MSANLPQWVNTATVVDASRTCTLNIRDRDKRHAKPHKGDECVAARCALDDGRPDDIKTGRYDLDAPAESQRLGAAVKRRTALRMRRERGEAPPPTHREYKARPMVGRIRSAARS
jgi:hypothetical protein